MAYKVCSLAPVMPLTTSHTILPLLTPSQPHRPLSVLLSLLLPEGLCNSSTLCKESFPPDPYMTGSLSLIYSRKPSFSILS